MKTHSVARLRGCAVGAACLLVGLVVLSSCGEKIALPKNIVDSPDGNLTDTVYVAVQPIWTGADGLDFSRPYGVSIGYDRTVYVCDTENDRIVRLTLEGEFIESYSVPFPVAVALYLLLLFDVAIPGRSITTSTCPAGAA